MERFARQLILPGFGPEAQRRLAEAHVVVVGAGGLGCPALLYLAAAGVGTLTVVDGDVVAESNLHRQVLYGPSDVGRPKAQVAAERLLALGAAEVHPIARHLVPETALALLAPATVVVDGSDNFATRYLVNDASVLLGKPLVWGTVYQYQGQYSVFNAPPFVPGTSPQAPNLRCLFPEQPAAESIPSCAEAGVLGPVAGHIGTQLALAAIRLLTGIGAPASGRLVAFDGLSGATDTFALPPDPANPLFTGAITALAPERYADASCPPIARGLSPGEFDVYRALPTTQLIDVREPWEHAAAHLGGRLIPLGSLPSEAHSLDPARPVVLYCQRGARSLAAAHQLAAQGFTDLFHLVGGLEGYTQAHPTGV